MAHSASPRLAAALAPRLSPAETNAASASRALRRSRQEAQHNKLCVAVATALAESTSGAFADCTRSEGAPWVSEKETRLEATALSQSLDGRRDLDSVVSSLRDAASALPAAEKAFYAALSDRSSHSVDAEGPARRVVAACFAYCSEGSNGRFFNASELVVLRCVLGCVSSAVKTRPSLSAASSSAFSESIAVAAVASEAAQRVLLSEASPPSAAAQPSPSRGVVGLSGEQRYRASRQKSLSLLTPLLSAVRTLLGDLARSRAPPAATPSSATSSSSSTCLPNLLLQLLALSLAGTLEYAAPSALRRLSGGAGGPDGVPVVWMSAGETSCEEREAACCSAGSQREGAADFRWQTSIRTPLGKEEENLQNRERLLSPLRAHSLRAVNELLRLCGKELFPFWSLLLRAKRRRARVSSQVLGEEWFERLVDPCRECGSQELAWEGALAEDASSKVRQAALGCSATVLESPSLKRWALGVAETSTQSSAKQTEQTASAFVPRLMGRREWRLRVAPFLEALEKEEEEKEKEKANALPAASPDRQHPSVRPLPPARPGGAFTSLSKFVSVAAQRAFIALFALLRRDVEALPPLLHEASPPSLSADATSMLGALVSSRGEGGQEEGRPSALALAANALRTLSCTLPSLAFCGTQVLGGAALAVLRLTHVFLWVFFEAANAAPPRLPLAAGQDGARRSGERFKLAAREVSQRAAEFLRGERLCQKSQERSPDSSDFLAFASLCLQGAVYTLELVSPALAALQTVSSLRVKALEIEEALLLDLSGNCALPAESGSSPDAASPRVSPFPQTLSLAGLVFSSAHFLLALDDADAETAVLEEDFFAAASALCRHRGRVVWALMEAAEEGGDRSVPSLLEALLRSPLPVWRGRGAALAASLLSTRLQEEASSSSYEATPRERPSLQRGKSNLAKSRESLLRLLRNHLFEAFLNEGRTRPAAPADGEETEENGDQDENTPTSVLSGACLSLCALSAAEWKELGIETSAVLRSAEAILEKRGKALATDVASLLGRLACDASLDFESPEALSAVSLLTAHLRRTSEATDSALRVALLNALGEASQAALRKLGSSETATAAGGRGIGAVVSVWKTSLETATETLAAERREGPVVAALRALASLFELVAESSRVAGKEALEKEDGPKLLRSLECLRRAAETGSAAVEGSCKAAVSAQSRKPLHETRKGSGELFHETTAGDSLRRLLGSGGAGLRKAKVCWNACRALTSVLQSQAGREAFRVASSPDFVVALWSSLVACLNKAELTKARLHAATALLALLPETLHANLALHSRAAETLTATWKTIEKASNSAEAVLPDSRAATQVPRTPRAFLLKYRQDLRLVLRQVVQCGLLQETLRAVQVGDGVEAEGESAKSKGRAVEALRSALEEARRNCGFLFIET